ncbi:hypothetical protein [Thermincola ferriacetica]
MVLDIIFILIVSLVFMPNGYAMVDGPALSTFNLMVSLLFLLVWFAYGFYRGKGQRAKFLVLASVYWAGTLLLVFLDTKLLGEQFFSLFLFTFAPLAGFLTLVSSDYADYSVLLYLLPLIVTACGYLAGSKLKPKVIEMN